MERKKKIAVVTGSRAEYGLLRPVLRHIQKSDALELQLIVTGMHTLKKFGNTAVEVQKEFPECIIIPIGDDDSMLESLAKEIRGIESFVTTNTPDVILVLGDRDEALAGAIVGGHMKTVVAHIHGGDTLGYLVDEAIRHSITKFAHIHFPATQRSANRIAQMGEEKKRIHVFGSTAFDTSELKQARTRLELAKEFKIDAQKDWLLVVQHPTPLDSTPLSKQLGPTLSALKKHPAQKIVIYPNSDTGSDGFIQSIDSVRDTKDFVVVKTLTRDRYLGFLKECAAMIGNSSSGIIEAGYFKKPVINIGNRQKGRECGQNVIHVGYDEKKISAALTQALSPSFKIVAKSTKHPYGSGNAAKKIVQTLEKLRNTDAIFYKKFSTP